MSQTLPSRPAVASPAQARGAIDWRRAGLLMALTFSFLQMLNEVGTMMAIPLYSSMESDLHLSAGEATWALMSTTIFGAATIALLAKAGDIFGHRRWMVVSVLGIAVGFVISALAPNLAVLIAGRALTGTMAGQALCVGIMNDRLTGGDRRRAIAIIAGGQAIGVFCGFALGGLIVNQGGTWREAFWIGAALTLVSLAAFLAWGKDSDARARLAGSRLTGSRPRIEPWGVLLLGVGLTLLCVGISQSTAWGLWTGGTLGCILGGLAALVLAFVAESRAKDPLLDVRQLVGRNLTPAYVVFLTLGICGMLLFNLGMTLLQVPGAAFHLGFGFGYSALTASYVFLPMTVAGLAAAKVVPGFVARTSASAALVAGGLLMGIAFLVIRLDYTQVPVLLVAIFCYGFGYTTLLSTSVAVIAGEARQGKGAGTASLYVAMALAASSIGGAIFAALENANMAPVTGPGGAPVAGPGGAPVVLPVHGLFDAGFLIAAGAAVVAIIAGLIIRPTHKVEVTAGH